MMNLPVFRRTGFKFRTPYPFELKYVDKKDFTPLQEMQHAALFDDKDKYIHVLTNWPSDEDIPDEAWIYLFRSDAVKCAAALLAGEAQGRFDLISAMSEAGTTPLHEAAWYQAINLTEFFLAHQEVADTKVRHAKLNSEEVSPLDVLFARLRCWIDEEKSKSAFKLISTELALMNEHLETLRLLANKTKKMDEHFSRYVMEGKMIEVGALLLVGYRPPCTSQFLGVDGDLEKQGTMELLGIFDRIGDELSAYIRINRSAKVRPARVVAEIASLFEDAGLPVKCKDTPLEDFPLWNSQRQDGEQFFSRRQQSPGILDPKYQGSFLPLRSYHSSSFVKADRNATFSTQLTHLVNVMPKHRFYHKCSVFLMSLRRVRHI